MTTITSAICIITQARFRRPTITSRSPRTAGNRSTCNSQLCVATAASNGTPYSNGAWNTTATPTAAIRAMSH
jgi:hypothetical protein